MAVAKAKAAAAIKKALEDKTSTIVSNKMRMQKVFCFARTCSR